jgi:hypothetical protein
MAGWKRLVRGSSVHKIESVDTVVNERRIILNPSFGPGPAKNEFELIFDRFNNDDAQAADESGRLMIRQRPTIQSLQSETHQHHDRERNQGIGYMGQWIENSAMRTPKVVMDH